VITVLARPWTLPWSVLAAPASLGPLHAPAYAYVAWLALITVVVAYLTGVLAVRLLSPQVAGVVSYLEAIVATVLAWLLLGEALTLPQLAGGVLVLVGAYVAQRSTPGLETPENEAVPVGIERSVQ